MEKNRLGKCLLVVGLSQRLKLVCQILLKNQLMMSGAIANVTFTKAYQKTIYGFLQA